MFSNQKVAKSSTSFECEKCNYITHKKFNFEKHLMTRRHQESMGINGFVAKSSKNEFICSICDKKYKDNSGLWRHKKICKETENEKLNEDDIALQTQTNWLQEFQITPKMFYDLLTKNNELQLKLVQLASQPNTNQSHNNIHSNNKTFNLQFFLNETCKDAMNLMDFVNSIEIDLSDTERLGEVGYVEGISDIINKNLKLLDVTKRPIHCTDQKRETIYIKEDDKWEKEEESKPNMRKMIKYVEHKNAKGLIEYRVKYPDCGDGSSKRSDKYNKMVLESMGGLGNNDTDKEDKIIRNVLKNTNINKEEYLTD